LGGLTLKGKWSLKKEKKAYGKVDKRGEVGRNSGKIAQYIWSRVWLGKPRRGPRETEKRASSEGEKGQNAEQSIRKRSERESGLKDTRRKKLQVIGSRWDRLKK